MLGVVHILGSNDVGIREFGQGIYKRRRPFRDDDASVGLIHGLRAFKSTSETYVFFQSLEFFPFDLKRILKQLNLLF
jgi:hypothetical protein